MNKDYKICFVCTGNACRSPFAECVTRKLLTDGGIVDTEDANAIRHVIILPVYAIKMLFET